MLPTQLGDLHAALHLFQMPMICALLNHGVFIKNFLRYLAKKILFF